MLSTTSSAPASCATPASASMSPMLSSGLVGVSTQTSRGLAGPDRGARPRRRRTTGAAVCSQPPRLLDLGEQPVGAAVRVVGDDHVVAGRAQRLQQRVLGREPAGEREARARPPRAPRGSPRGRCGSGWRGGSTRSRRAARRRRPACRCWSRRSAGSPRRWSGRARSPRGSRASRTRPSGVLGALAQRTCPRRVRLRTPQHYRRRIWHRDPSDALHQWSQRPRGVPVLFNRRKLAIPDARAGAAGPRGAVVQHRRPAPGARRARRHRRDPRGLRGRRLRAGLLLGRRGDLLADPRRLVHLRRVRRRHDAAPVLRGGLLAARPATPRPCASSSTRPGCPTPTWSRRSSSSTTRPRACGRATTSARSTARRSTPSARSRRRPPRS